MKLQTIRISVVMTLLSAGIFAVWTNPKVQAANDVPDSIEDVMEINHSGKKSLTNKVKTAVKAGNWADAATHAKKMSGFAASLGQYPCPHGDASSWKKLCGVYAADTAAITAAVAKKDAAAANAAIGKLTKSCKTCHQAHRE